MFFTYLRRELRRRMRQAVFIALGLAVGIGLVITVTAASAILSGVSPYFAKSSGASPLSPKVSLTPILLMGTGWFSTITSATADPRPP